MDIPTAAQMSLWLWNRENTDSLCSQKLGDLKKTLVAVILECNRNRKLSAPQWLVSQPEIKMYERRWAKPEPLSRAYS